MQFANNLADSIQGEIAGVPVDPKKKYLKEYLQNKNKTIFINKDFILQAIKY